MTKPNSKWIAVGAAVLAGLLCQHGAKGLHCGPISSSAEHLVSRGKIVKDPSARHDALTRAGKILSPELENFDYRMFAGEMDDASHAKLQRFLASHDARHQGYKLPAGSAARDGIRVPDVDGFGADNDQMLFARTRPSNFAMLSAAHVQRLDNVITFAGASYCSGVTTSQCTSKHCRLRGFQGAKVVRDIVNGATRALIVVREKTREIIVAFRGTNNWKNWVDNLNFGKVAFPYASGAVGMVHQGFLKTYQRVRNQMHAALAEVIKQYPQFNVVFTGHSQGGAVATLAAGDMSTNLALLKPRVTLVTIGSPRVGDAQFARWISDTHLGSSERIVQANDIVPHVPAMWMGFSHIAAERYVFKDREVHMCKGLEDSSCSNSRVPFVSLIAHGKFLDHDGFFFGFLAC